jgi:histidinol dehydrogenase
VLPTAGCACHSSGLNTKSFLKAMHVIDYDRAALAEIAEDVVTFAEAEDLPSHGRAVSIRQEERR